MKLNKKLIRSLADGEIVYQHTGTAEDYQAIVTRAFPDYYVIYSDNKTFIAQSYINDDEYHLYKTKEIMHQFGNYKDLPIYTTEQFFDQNSEVKQPIDDETRELAKRLFEGKMYAGHLPSAHAMKQAIANAKDFVKLLNAKS